MGNAHLKIRKEAWNMTPLEDVNRKIRQNSSTLVKTSGLDSVAWVQILPLPLTKCEILSCLFHSLNFGVLMYTMATNNSNNLMKLLWSPNEIKHTMPWTQCIVHSKHSKVSAITVTATSKKNSIQELQSPGHCSQICHWLWQGLTSPGLSFSSK